MTKVFFAAAMMVAACFALPIAGQVSDEKGDADVTGNKKVSSNYDQQAISISYNKDEGDDGLPMFATLNGTVTELDQVPATIMLNRTHAELNCSAGFMNVKMQFQRPFYGIVYADFDRNSACKITGDGLNEATIQLPLKGCGTLQRPARVFTNNIVVRFHPGLEMDIDEVITIICRYPPPIVPPPVIPAGLQLPPPEVVRTLQPLKEFEILLIICAIIFLALMLLGIGCSYYCLKKRNIKVVKRRPASTLGSEVTKISEPISMFGALKIPRAHAEDSSGTEELTESVHSEFPSELMSIISDEDYTSAYSDAPFELAEGKVYPSLHAPPAPGFDIKMAVKNGVARPYSPASSKASSESELVLKAQEQYLTTILERTETNTLETLERIRRAEAAAMGPPPVHARLRVVDNRAVSETSEMESESEYSQITDIQDFYHDKLQLSTSEQANFTLDARAGESMEDKTYGKRSSGAAIGKKPKPFRGAMSKSQIAKIQEELQESEHQVTETTVVTSTGQQDFITPVIHDRTSHMNIDVTPRNNFDVLIRILDNGGSAYEAEPRDDDDASSVLTDVERFRLKEVIMQDENIQNFLKTSYTTEKILMLKDYDDVAKVIEPQKWDVLIRIIGDNSDALSTAQSSVDTKSSPYKSSSATAQEVRSMTETTVDFTNFGAMADPEARSAYSGVSSYTQARSVADRSGAEFVESDYAINREAYFASSEYHSEAVQQGGSSSTTSWSVARRQ